MVSVMGIARVPGVPIEKTVRERERRRRAKAERSE